MEHAIFTTVVGIGSLVSVIGPVYYFSQAKKHENNLRLKIMQVLEENHKLNLADKETWGKCYAIGLDKEKKKLAYIKVTSCQSEISTIIDLSDYQSCERVVKYRIIDGNKLFERLSLVLKRNTEATPETILEFFFSSGSIALQGEMQALNKWNGIINAVLIK